MALSENPNLALIPSGYKAGKIYSVLPTNGVGDFNFARGSVATRINSSGLIEEVASNVPRLNYPLIDGVVKGCPHHILEPQRTNYVFPSNGFVSWTGGLSISQNYGISPDGSQNSTKIFGQGLIFKSPNRPTSDYVFSVFAKNINEDSSIIQLRIDIPSSLSAEFDLSNGTIVNNNTDDAKIEYYGNGWYRCMVIQNNDGIANTVISNGSAEDLSCEIFGAMLEEGSHPTSYIPTTTAAVTRSAETANGSGDAATFNDSEGVLMVETSALADDGNFKFISISDGTTSNRVSVYFDNLNKLSASVPDVAAFSSNVNIKNNNKVAFKYKSGGYSFYVNGFELGTSTSTAGLHSGLNTLNFDFGGGSDDFYGNIKQLQYFDTTLTDSELEKLTSWVSFTDMAEAQLYSIE